MRTTVQRLHTSGLMILAAQGNLFASENPTNRASGDNPPAIERAIPRLNVKTGFQVKKVADDPLVESPAALDFDERGRLFVAELRGWPVPESGREAIGQIRLLEDTDGDGEFDTSVVVADGLDRPTGLVCSRGGVFVSCENEVFYLRDEDGDDIADLRRRVLTFSGASTTDSLDSFRRSMTLGPDLRIYIAHPDDSVLVQDPNGTLTHPLRLTGGGFSLDPLSLELRAESGETVFGQTFDLVGRRYMCTGSAAVGIEVIDALAARRNPYSPPGPTAAVVVPASNVGGPRACRMYFGDKYGSALKGKLLLADPTGGSVSMVELREGGVHAQAVVNNGLSATALVEGEDSAFNPIELTIGPDDHVYFADLALPSGGAAASTPHGRIWKLVLENGPGSTATAPVAVATDHSLDALEHPNTWIRATAARVLVEKGPSDVAPELRKRVQYGKESMTRLRALRVLQASRLATASDLLEASKQADATLRAAIAILLTREGMRGADMGKYSRILHQLSRDRSAEVRLRAASAMGSVPSRAAALFLADLYLRDLDSAWMSRVLLTVNPDLMVPLWFELVSDRRVRASGEAYGFLADLTTTIGLVGVSADITSCLATLQELEMPAGETLPLMNALAQGLAGRARRFSSIDSTGRTVSLASAVQVIATDAPDAMLRAEAVKVLGACIGPELVADEYLLLLFAPGLPEPMQVPVIRALAAQGLPRDFEALTQRWHLWGPPQQLATIDVLLETDEGARALLSAVELNTIPPAALTSIHLNLLRDHPAQDVRVRARRLFGEAVTSRDEILREFIDVVDLHGSNREGRRLFEQRCSYCHAAWGGGPGPPVPEMRTASPLQLVASIVDPSREIAGASRTTILRLSDGRMVWGSTGQTDGPVIDLSTPEGPRRYLREAVRSVENPPWSLMPDNIAGGLTRQNIADIVQFLRLGDPTASGRP